MGAKGSDWRPGAGEGACRPQRGCGGAGPFPNPIECRTEGFGNGSGLSGSWLDRRPGDVLTSCFRPFGHGLGRLPTRKNSKRIRDAGKTEDGKAGRRVFPQGPKFPEGVQKKPFDNDWPDPIGGFMARRLKGRRTFPSDDFPAFCLVSIEAGGWDGSAGPMAILLISGLVWMEIFGWGNSCARTFHCFHIWSFV